jgi:Dockerin type I domain/Cohesin domain
MTRNVASLRNVGAVLSIVLVLMLIIPATGNFVPKSRASSEISQQGHWQLREMKWFADIPPDYSFSSPEPSILRVESTDLGQGGGYVFVQFERADLDGKKLQIRWNAYHTYSDLRDLYLLSLFVFDKAFDRTEMSDYFTEDIPFIFPPPGWNITYSWLEGPHYPGPLGAPVGWEGWRTDTTNLLDLSSWTSEIVTVLLKVRDGWSADSVAGDFAWFKVLDASDNEVYSCDFSGDVLMEVTSTYHDYGVLATSGESVPKLAILPSVSEANCTAPGFCFSANIDVSNVMNLYGYGLKLSYDPTVLELSSVELNVPQVWGSDYFIVQNQTGGGIYSLAVTALPPAPIFEGNMTLATLNFSLTREAFIHLAGKTVQAFLDLYETVLADNQAMNIIHATSDAAVTIHVILVADLNGDGVVNILDVVKLALAYGTTPSDPNWNADCDLNNDGIINILDLVIIATNYGRTTHI